MISIFAIYHDWPRATWILHFYSSRDGHTKSVGTAMPEINTQRPIISISGRKIIGVAFFSTCQIILYLYWRIIVIFTVDASNEDDIKPLLFKIMTAIILLIGAATIKALMVTSILCRNHVSSWLLAQALLKPLQWCAVSNRRARGANDDH